MPRASSAPRKAWNTDALCRNIHFPSLERITNDENTTVGNRIVARRRIFCRYGHGASDHLVSGARARLDSTDVIPVGRFHRLRLGRSGCGRERRPRPARPATSRRPRRRPRPREKPAAEKPKEEEKKEEEKPAKEGPYKLFHGPWLECEHLDIRGYLEAGFTNNPTWPLSGFNGPDGYNDLANQGVLDQFYLIAERVAKVENDCGIDYGYRADVMFGTDAHFVTTTPGTQWDSNWNGGSSYYGIGHAPVIWHFAIQQVDAPGRPLLCPLRL